jgi:hypothetical protein
MANQKKSNNKRYRKQNQRKQFPWLLVVLGGGLLLLATILFTNGSGVGGTPALKVDQDKIDYGYVKFGENRQFTFTVTNTGEGNLRFKEKPYIEVLEGC